MVKQLAFYKISNSKRPEYITFLSCINVEKKQGTSYQNVPCFFQMF